MSGRSRAETAPARQVAEPLSATDGPPRLARTANARLSRLLRAGAATPPATAAAGNSAPRDPFRDRPRRAGANGLWRLRPGLHPRRPPPRLVVIIFHHDTPGGVWCAGPNSDRCAVKGVVISMGANPILKGVDHQEAVEVDREATNGREPSMKKGCIGNLASRRAITRVNVEQASKILVAEADPPDLRGRPGRRARSTGPDRFRRGSAGSDWETQESPL